MAIDSSAYHTPEIDARSSSAQPLVNSLVRIIRELLDGNIDDLNDTDNDLYDKILAE